VHQPIETAAPPPLTANGIALPEDKKDERHNSLLPESLVFWPPFPGRPASRIGGADCPLASLSEYELRDVGLTRQDLVDFTARPLDEDPTPHLNRARISRARRA
jgi:hypothetical protein